MEVRESNVDTTPSLALQFTALTASLITPVRLARLTDIDTDAAIWHIPADHSRLDFEQQIPLSRDAISVIARAEEIDRRGSDLVFPSRRGTILDGNTLPYLCKKLNLDVRPYQFRFGFRRWCRSSFVRPELAECALGLKFPHPRFFRPLYLDERRLLMQAWADFLAGDLADDWFWCEPVPGELIQSSEKWHRKVSGQQRRERDISEMHFAAEARIKAFSESLARLRRID